MSVLLFEKNLLRFSKLLRGNRWKIKISPKEEIFFNPLVKSSNLNHLRVGLNIEPIACSDMGGEPLKTLILMFFHLDLFHATLFQKDLNKPRVWNMPPAALQSMFWPIWILMYSVLCREVGRLVSKSSGL